MRKIVEAEIMAETHHKIQITLTNGEVIVGRSWGIEPEFDYEGEEEIGACIHIETEIPDGYHYYLRDEDIVKTEKAP